jgi:hypothetical protein
VVTDITPAEVGSSNAEPGLQVASVFHRISDTPENAMIRAAPDLAA